MVTEKLQIIRISAGIWALASFLISSFSNAQTIEQMLSTLTYNHPQVRSAVKSVASSKQEIKKATASFLPKVNLASDFGPEKIDSPSRRASQNNKKWQRSKQTTTEKNHERGSNEQGGGGRGHGGKRHSTILRCGQEQGWRRC